MDPLFLFWMIATGVFLVLEFVTAALCSIWFVGGTLAALIACSLHAELWVQILLFFLVSGLCFLILYPRLKKRLNQEKYATNADMTLGQTCVVTQTIDNLSSAGAVTVGGKTWTARSASGEIIPAGQLVTALRIEGVKLIVSPLPAEAKTPETV